MVYTINSKGMIYMAQTVNADPFYSEANIRYLENKYTAYKASKLNMKEHKLIEEHFSKMKIKEKKQRSF